MKKIPLLVIAGPTGVGKTECAIRLAKMLNGEIISADSMQVYKYMDIGTAKPDDEEQQEAKHHLIDIVEPDQDFTVSDYKNLFDMTVPLVVAAGKLPMVVGGTGLYIRVCLQSYLTGNPAGADWELRKRLNEQADEKGLSYLFEELKRVDLIAAGRIHPNDKRRIIRALEVYENTGKPISELHANQVNDSIYTPVYLFLDRERSELYRRIEERVDRMFEKGFLQEVRSLLERGYSPGLKPMQGLGYHQINEYFQNKFSLEQAIAQVKQQTRNYAKRQLTWFRKEPVDLSVDMTGNNREFFGEILVYLEGRLSGMSNN